MTTSDSAARRPRPPFLRAGNARGILAGFVAVAACVPSLMFALELLSFAGNAFRGDAGLVAVIVLVPLGAAGLGLAIAGVLISRPRSWSRRVSWAAAALVVVLGAVAFLA